MEAELVSRSAATVLLHFLIQIYIWYVHGFQGV